MKSWKSMLCESLWMNKVEVRGGGTNTEWHLSYVGYKKHSREVQRQQTLRSDLQYEGWNFGDKGLFWEEGVFAGWSWGHPMCKEADTAERCGARMI